jgi:hypothetical protein
MQPDRNLYGGDLNFQTRTFRVRRGYVVNAPAAVRQPWVRVLPGTSLDSATPFGLAYSGPALLENLWISI